MQGLGVLVEIQDTLAAAVGARRMRALHQTLQRMISALETGIGPGADQKGGRVAVFSSPRIVKGGRTTLGAPGSRLARRKPIR
jgi:hypothetical protein